MVVCRCGSGGRGWCGAAFLFGFCPVLGRVLMVVYCCASGCGHHVACPGVFSPDAFHCVVSHGCPFGIVCWTWIRPFAFVDTTVAPQWGHAC